MFVHVGVYRTRSGSRAGVYLDFLDRGMVAVLGGAVTDQIDFANVPL